MDENSIIEQLRGQADRDESGHTDVDALVRGALVQGHRRRARRRVGAAVLAVVAAGAVGTVLVTGLPTARLSGPVGGPVSAVPSPVAPSPSASPSAADGSPTRSATTGAVSGSPTQVRTTLADLLPVALTVTRSSAARELGGNGFDWENNAALTVRDDRGTSYLFGGVGNGSYDEACFGVSDCTTSTLPDGGTLWVSNGPPGDKTGSDRNFYYNRPEGGHVWLTERNAAEGNLPVTRPGLPLSVAEGREILTSPRWDDLFQG